MKRRIRFISLIIIIVLICGLFAGCGSSNAEQHVTDTQNQKSEVSIEDKETEDNDPTESKLKETVETDIENTNLVEKLGRGINIGNSLDCFDEWNESAVVTETYWGNPEITEDYVKKLVEAGFKTIRIPVTWTSHIVDNKIDDSFMARVKEVVDYAYNAGANVIIDIHHDRKFAPSYGNYSFAKEYLENVWGQVALEFKDYDDRLIFEGINEPRFYGREDEWSNGTPEGVDNVNKLMLDFVNIVRNTGGNNASRLLLITCYCNRSDRTALDKLIIPKDDNIGISIHSYDPYEFTSSGGAREFDDGEKSSLEYTINALRSYKEQHNIPVVITECGAYESVGKKGRIGYLRYLLDGMDAIGVPCVLWDNGQGYGYGAYGIIDRNSGYPFDQEILETIMKEN